MSSSIWELPEHSLDEIIQGNSGRLDARLSHGFPVELNVYLQEQNYVEIRSGKSHLQFYFPNETDPFSHIFLLETDLNIYNTQLNETVLKEKIRTAHKIDAELDLDRAQVTGEESFSDGYMKGDTFVRLGDALSSFGSFLKTMLSSKLQKQQDLYAQRLFELAIFRSAFQEGYGFVQQYGTRESREFVDDILDKYVQLLRLAKNFKASSARVHKRVM